GIEDLSLPVDEAKDEVGFGGVDAHGAVIGVVEFLAAAHARETDVIPAFAAEPVHEIGQAVDRDAFIEVIVAAEDGAGAPFAEGPAREIAFARPGTVHRPG